MEDRAVQLQLLAQLARVGQRAVVRHGHEALDVIDHDGLRVLAGVEAGRAVADVCHGQIALPERFDDLGRKDVVDQTRVLVAAHDPLFIDGDARALLAAVLKREKAVIAQRRDVEHIGAVHAENAAFIMDTAHSLLPRPIAGARRRSSLMPFGKSKERCETPLLRLNAAPEKHPARLSAPLL